MKKAVSCPYCGQLAVYNASSMHLFHGINYGPVYECDPCDARIGADPNTGEPKGTLANKPTRLLRQFPRSLEEHAQSTEHWYSDECPEVKP